MKRQLHTLLLAAATCVLLAGSLQAEGQNQRYIVILKQRGGAVPDVAALGGTIESRQEEQLIVTIPPASLAALRADAKVRYVERVGGTPSEGEDALIGVPVDPAPGAASNARFTPHALGSTSWNPGDYVYDGAGNIVSIGADTYAYDGVQRLRQSLTRGMPEAYTYDGFGNMTTKTNNGLAQQVPSVETATNRYVGSDYTYNEIGAMKSGASYVFTYDALGQPLSKKYNNDSSTQEYYIYTPGDERIGVQRGTWWTWSVRDEGGKVLRQYRSSTTNPTDAALWLEDFVWRDGLLLGSQRVPELGGRRHYHLDHLGTPRLVTADNGQRISTHDYFPFGDEYTPIWQEVAAGYDREDPMKFTGHERDYAYGMGAEEGHAIDDMHARYYSPTLGRFISVDPLRGDPGDPQSWNRYVYVEGGPLLYVDPTGRNAVEGSPMWGRCTVMCDDPGGMTITVTAPKDKDSGSSAPPYVSWMSWFSRLGSGGLGVLDLASRASYGDWQTAAPTPLLTFAETITVYAQAPRLPDAANLTVNVGGVYGGTATYSLDRYGHLYYNLPIGGWNVGRSATIVSFSASAVWMNSTTQPSEERLQSVLAGDSYGFGGGYYFGGAVSGNSSGSMTQLGYFTPQVGGSWTYSLSPASACPFVGEGIYDDPTGLGATYYRPRMCSFCQGYPGICAR
jgi:RHS repeat-associated protein